MSPSVDWAALLPQIFLGGGSLVMLTLGTLVRKRAPWWLPNVLGIGLTLAAFGSVVWQWVRVQDPSRGAFSTIAGTVQIDGFAVFLSGVVVIAALLALVFAPFSIRRAGLPPEEFSVLLLLSAAGGVTLASANDLIVLFLGLEVLSIAAYVLAALDLRRAGSQEAGLKYFVLGAFASAFFLYGAALIYGAAGSTKLDSVAAALAAGAGSNARGMLLAGFALLLVGLFFKVAAVPFHAWTPDVYEGAPSPAVAYMAAGVKAAGFAALLRLFAGTFSASSADWRPAVAVVAVITVLAGSALGVISGDVRRLLAYSSIGHAGFILVGLESAGANGTSASLLYLGVYAFMALGSFAVVMVMGRDASGSQPLAAYDGLARRSPWLALGFTLLLLAQAGLPFTTGFWAKFEVIGAAVQSRTYWLAAVSMLGAVVAAFVYLRLVVRMYLVRPGADGDALASQKSGVGLADDSRSGDEDSDSRPPVAVPRSVGFVVAVCAAVTLFFGVWPAPLLNLAGDATLAVLGG